MNVPRRIAFVTGFILATLLHSVQAQVPARRVPEPPLPLLFKETWTVTPDSELLSQTHVTNPDLLVTVYGNPPDLTSQSGTPHIWTGLCNPACGVTLKLKDSYADLSSRQAHIMWHSRTSGFHQIRPLVKLADGRMLVGDFADMNMNEYRVVDFQLAPLGWLLLDPATLTTKGTLLTDVDLGKVDEVGFIDLTPGSGHGFGGYSAVGWIEVYGQAAAR